MSNFLENGRLPGDRERLPDAPAMHFHHSL
jgi:hypothetical protein